jgi:hypothetical protein
MTGHSSLGPAALMILVLLPTSTVWRRAPIACTIAVERDNDRHTRHDVRGIC